MSYQRDLYRSCTSKSYSRQPDLFPRHHFECVGLRCDTCGAHMVRTPSGYLACPGGHGRLLAEAVDSAEDGSGQLFTDHGEDE